MGMPQSNPSGYVNASISNVEGFRHVDFLLAHGKLYCHLTASSRIHVKST